MPIPFEFDKPRTLTYGIGELRELEAVAGGDKTAGDLYGEMSRFGVTATVQLLWAGLKHEDAALTQNLVGKMLQTYWRGAAGYERRNLMLKAVAEALVEAGVFRDLDQEAAVPNA